jgi:hypothetical protein
VIVEAEIHQQPPLRSDRDRSITQGWLPVPIDIPLTTVRAHPVLLLMDRGFFHDWINSARATAFQRRKIPDRRVTGEHRLVMLAVPLAPRLDIGRTRPPTGTDPDPGKPLAKILNHEFGDCLGLGSLGR